MFFRSLIRNFAAQTKHQKENMKISELIKSSFLAGVCIGIAGFGYLAEKSIIGAVLFSFGLLTVVHYALKLYTGTAGFIKRGKWGHCFSSFFSTSWDASLYQCLCAALPCHCRKLRRVFWKADLQWVLCAEECWQ